jgi:hypothetical protein
MDAPKPHQEHLPPSIEIPTPKIGLPEYLREETIESLLPGTIAYLYANRLTYDRKTEQIWLNVAGKIEESDLRLSNYARNKERIAVMPVYTNETDGKAVYVIDATGVKPGAVSTANDLLEYGSDKTPEPGSLLDEKRRKHQAPVAVAYKNLEDRVEYHGDPAYFEHLQFLVTEYTDALAQNDVS